MMKTLRKLKLHKLSQAQLDKNEQNRLLGGSSCCSCNCSSGSTKPGTIDNGLANNYYGLSSSGGVIISAS